MKLRKNIQAYPNYFKRDSLSTDLHAVYDKCDRTKLAKQAIRVRIAGRIMARRFMGKVSFANVQDMTGCIQIYLTQDNLPEGMYSTFKTTLDLGDIVGIEGELLKQKRMNYRLK